MNQTNRLNLSYENQLIGNEICHSKENGKLEKSKIIDSFDYDNRIDLFQTLSKSILFHEKSIMNDDLEFWFPECKLDRNIKKVIPKQKVQQSLECVIAEVMEGNIEII